MEGTLVFERDGRPLEVAVGRFFLVSEGSAS
jgi:hypothetical protein